ncbi:XdhC family protein [Gordonia paraffinivorans]|uniref:XdhC family protein n=2 Tax=Gordonia paraffinivorans TaxID=175628 RepID=UPI001B3571E0|nr:XdhC family protein [Gordonia paraffinivorans]
MMRDVVGTIARWHDAGIDCAIATIIASRGSIPLPVGSIMAFSRDGAVAGSISGGCVESDLFHEAMDVLDTRVPVIRTYAVDDAGAIGLMCGGSITVLVHPAGPADLPGLSAVSGPFPDSAPVSVATIVSDGDLQGRTIITIGNQVAGTCGNPLLDAEVIKQSRRHLEAASAVTVDMSVTGNCLESDVRVLFSSTARPPHLMVFGAVDFAHALIRSAKVLGYRVTLCDARPVFATPERFPEADEVVTMWPHEYLETQEISASTFICVLTHDPKFDVPALTVALRSGAGYVGAMGSRRTHHDRLGRLRAAGVTDTELTGLSSPIGLDLGAATPEETAISILGEIIAARRGGTGRPLGQVDGPIHRSAPVITEVPALTAG